MAVVDAFLGAFLTVLLENLAHREQELLKFLRGVGIDAELKEWRRKLQTIKAVLTDAEDKQTKNEAVKIWLNDLEDLAYDLDDLVDGLNTEAMLRKLRENKGSTRTVRKLIPSCCINLSFADYMFDRGIESELEGISGRLDDLFKQISDLCLVKNGKGRHYGTAGRVQMTSLVVDSEVHGRDEDKDKIVKILLGAESNDSPIIVIPIVGMGGVGKTTLVQLVYNDKRLEDKFDLKAWACVSDNFDAMRLTKSILEAVSSQKCDYQNFDTLQVKLKESLSKKKFLLVLDDIWNENYGEWDILRQPFLAREPGSKIIITARQETVAKIVSEIPAYHLSVLSEEDALSMLAQHALGVKTFDMRPDLREIGKSVVKRCKNLPLAVKVLGGLLRSKLSPKEWEEVLKSKIWMEEKIGILPDLKLSYEYLPPQLKRCFAYCALFPKDYEFDEFQLVQLWRAEGLVQKSENGMSIEELASRYFNELLARSFFEQSSANAARFVMHDLLNDLAVSIDGHKCLRMDDVTKENIPTRISEKVCHLSFNRSWQATFRISDCVNEVQRLRTFLPLPVESIFTDFFSQRILLRLLPNMCRLRVLSLNGYQICKLPNSIGDLRHLRYLNLGTTALEWLPESVSTLINLEVLLLRGCWRLAKLPTSMKI